MNSKEHKSTYCSTCESDTKEAHFVRNIKNRYGKYKGKLPFNCFSCGKVGHFPTKFFYAKNESSDDEEYYNVKKGNKHHQNTKEEHWLRECLLDKVEVCLLCDLDRDTKEFPSLPKVKADFQESIMDMEQDYFISQKKPWKPRAPGMNLDSTYFNSWNNMDN